MPLGVASLLLRAILSPSIRSQVGPSSVENHASGGAFFDFQRVREEIGSDIPTVGLGGGSIKGANSSVLLDGELGIDQSVAIEVSTVERRPSMSSTAISRS